MRFLLLSLLFTARLASAACFATPQLAVHAALDPSMVPNASEGFRAIDLVADPIAHEVWARVEQCGHPERPLQLIPIHLVFAHLSYPSSTPSVVQTQSPIVVHAGQSVRVIWIGAKAHLELQAVAEHDGRIDEVISAKLPSFSSNVASQSHIRARVSGPGELIYQP